MIASLTALRPPARCCRASSPGVYTRAVLAIEVCFVVAFVLTAAALVTARSHDWGALFTS